MLAIAAFFKSGYRSSFKKKIYLVGLIATFMNVAIDLTYSRVLKTRLKPLINAVVG